MQFSDTALEGVIRVEPDIMEDDRGFFARMWCKSEFAERGLNPELVQCNLSSNTKRGTLRGMHIQVAPHEEAKLVRCVSGAIYDVVIDLRPGSPTFGRWESYELSADVRTMLYIPTGCAHGFQTLEDHTEVFYQMSQDYHPESSLGIRWNDSHFGITWPISEPTMSARDRSYPDYSND